MVVAKLTVILTLQFMVANITFIIVLIAIIFLDQSICKRLPIGEEENSESDAAEAQIIMFCSSSGIDFQPAVSFLASSCS